MPSRRRFLQRICATAATGTLAATAGCLGGEFVRTKLGGSFTTLINLSSPEEDRFTLPDQFTTYVNQMREAYGEAAIPWQEPGAFTGEFVGAYTRQEEVHPNHRFAVQDATVLVHRLDEARYQLRLWSAGRLLGKSYEVDPWGYYTEEPAFTWLEQAIEVEYDDHLSTRHSLSSNEGRVNVAGGAVTVPQGSYSGEVVNEVHYRSRWESFYAGVVPLIGACEISFSDREERRFNWELSNGVGIRTPF